MSHLSDELLSRDLDTCFARDHETTAALLARIAEFDERKLYLPAGYPSMLAYCVERGHYTEQAAYKRIFAARAARRFPAIFDAIAGGRLHLSAVVLLARHLTENTAEELLSAATHKTKAEIEQMLAARFPASEVLTWVAVPAAQNVPPLSCQLSPGKAARVHEVHKVTPLSTESYAVQFTMSQGAREKLRYVQALLGHRVAPGDLAQVFEQALDALIPQIEKQKFAATDRPRRSHGSANPRRVPAHVKRAVWQRDEGRCTFVSDDGHRCQADTNLEFDHVTEVARGGEATVDGIRLLCRAHNQFAAERTFGAEFMRHKRIAAAEARAAAKAARAQQAATSQPTGDEETDVVPYLRALRFSPAEARRAAEQCRDMPPGATIEDRVRMALKSIRVRGTRFVPAPAAFAMSPQSVSAG
jgi:5-methylcytosine-specific restriction endonuclease McrA